MRQKILLLQVAVCSFILSISSALLTDIWLKKPILWHSIGLQKAYNYGIAFSIHLGPWQTGIILGALILICSVALRSALNKWQQVGFGLLLGGAVSNVVDRLLDGKVTDMLRVKNFPIFNVADTCINIGVAIVIALALIEWWQQKNNI